MCQGLSQPEDVELSENQAEAGIEASESQERIFVARECAVKKQAAQLICL